MIQECGHCHVELKKGDLVYQLANGKYDISAITPNYSGYGPVQAEWHATCLVDSGMFPQLSPYNCSVCGDPVEHGSSVVYMTKGTKPSAGYMRLERRGDTLPFIGHRKCVEDRIEVGPAD